MIFQLKKNNVFFPFSLLNGGKITLGNGKTIKNFQGISSSFFFSLLLWSYLIFFFLFTEVGKLKADIFIRLYLSAFHGIIPTNGWEFKKRKADLGKGK